jgi:hypothetical protein
VVICRYNDLFYTLQVGFYLFFWLIFPLIFTLVHDEIHTKWMNHRGMKVDQFILILYEIQLPGPQLKG